MLDNFSLVQPVDNPQKRVLFLGYSADETSLISALINVNCEVWYTKDKIKNTTDFDLIVSFGYRHILNKSFIENSKCPIINLHISYLPWNRGAHPNFWSFFDCTPSGVSIHLIDEGIDTGPIIYQKYVDFNKTDITFSQSHRQLIYEIESLFKVHIVDIINGTYRTFPQRRLGSFHKKSDLPSEFSGWESNVYDELLRLDSLILTNNIR